MLKGLIRELILAACFLRAGDICAGEAEDAIARMREAWEKVESYQVEISYRQVKGSKTEERTVRFSYRRPGWVRNDIIKGRDEGAVAIYDPNKNLVYARYPWMPVALSFPPDADAVTTLRGDQMHHTSFGYMLKRVEWFLSHGGVKFMGEEVFEGAACVIVEFYATDGQDIRGVIRERSWLDTKTSFPRRVASYDRKGHELQWVVLRYLVLNPELPERYFNP